MSEAENRLEVARQAKLFAGAVPPLRDVLLEKRRSKIHYVDGAPAKYSRLRTKYSEYATCRLRTMEYRVSASRLTGRRRPS